MMMHVAPAHTQVARIPTRFAPSYLLRGDDGWIVFDTSLPRSERTILHALQACGGQPGDIRLILLSHGHPDHAGSAAALRALTGAKVAIHPGDVNLVRTGSRQIPPTRSLADHLIRGLLGVGALFLRTQPVEPDVLLTDGQRLDGFGLGARVVHTPGHTAGSISLVLDTGEALIADAVGMQAGVPRENRLLVDPSAALESLRMLAALPIHTCYPGHADPFPARRLAKLLQEMERELRTLAHPA
jgi:glyoxylase-like metal-dependent hydrolase (beta-lactamase superfamily II)